jgi:prophage antirepressor-like protein
MDLQNKIVLFEGKKLRRVWHNEEWYFSIIDAIEILTDSARPRKYWSDLKTKLKNEGSELSDKIGQLKVEASDGKKYQTDCINTEGLLRLIMSIPSPKAEPFKMWLANVGKQTLDEIQDPELGFDRLREVYKAKGYSDEWIERRMQSIEVRKQLTEEWKNRGVKEGQEYAILTAIIAKGTFGVTPTEHKDIKGLTEPKQNLRDHMTPLELIFTALGEEATRQVAIRDDVQGFNENHDAAQMGGAMAGEALKSFEKKGNVKVVSSENFLNKLNETNTQKEIDDTKNDV